MLETVSDGAMTENWKLAIFAMLMMPLAAFVAKSLGKRVGKATTESTKINAKTRAGNSFVLREKNTQKNFLDCPESQGELCAFFGSFLHFETPVIF